MMYGTYVKVENSFPPETKERNPPPPPPLKTPVAGYLNSR